MQKKAAPVQKLGSRYSQIDRGSYKGNTYKVKKGETLSLISYVSGKSVSSIVKYNNLRNPNTIYPGQILRLTPPKVKKTWRVTPTRVSTTAKKTTPVKKTIAAAKKKVTPKKKVTSKKVVRSTPKKSTQKTTKKAVPKKVVQKKTTSKPKKVVQSQNTHKNTPVPTSKVSKWSWPTRGKIVQKYSSVKGNKGVNIAGKKGQPIYATAPGKVVYAGNALRGYGNIILIKHNANYMSAYAHNDSLLVKVNQQVKSGQKIALMGKTSSPIVQLHFEIRYKGKSVDPLRYLP